jgi:ribosomal protein L11 methyltransferase
MSSILGATTGLGAGAGHCKTFILATDFEGEGIEKELNIIFNQHNITYLKSIIKEENWNAIWESNFEPVRVGDFVGIRAHFHPSFDPAVQYEIKITPKMSFGTGHHATTFTVMQMMEHLNFRGKSVYDFGTGTGVLAILAEKLGAVDLLAVDNDDWCIENANENILNNDTKCILIKKVDSAYQNRPFDIILANVNRHILEANMKELTQVAHLGSELILSGLLIDDQEDMIQLAANNGWNFVKSQPLNGWVSLLFNL